MSIRAFIAAAGICAAASPAHADCLLDAKAVVSGMVKLPPFHIAIKTTSNNIESRMTGDVVMPDSFKLIFGNTTMIVTPQGAWTSVKGQWKAGGEDSAQNMRHALLSGMTDDLTTMRNVKCDPKFKAQGKTYKLIEYDVYKTPADKQPLAHKRILLGKNDLPQWIIAQGATGKTNSAVVQKFTYDPKITIKAPP